VLQYGPDAEVLEPRQVRDAVRERLERVADGSG
jgi:predicted DNA-binding transcriptional regulator YafY